MELGGASRVCGEEVGKIRGASGILRKTWGNWGVGVAGLERLFNPTKPNWTFPAPQLPIPLNCPQSLKLLPGMILPVFTSPRSLTEVSWGCGQGGLLAPWRWGFGGIGGLSPPHLG